MAGTLLTWSLDTAPIEVLLITTLPNAESFSSYGRDELCLHSTQQHEYALPCLLEVSELGTSLLRYRWCPHYRYSTVDRHHKNKPKQNTNPIKMVDERMVRLHDSIT